MTKIITLVHRELAQYPMIRAFILLFLLYFSVPIRAQDAPPGLLLNFSYAAQWPGGDLSDRFGQNFSLGLGGEFITKKKHLLLGLEGNYLFGDQVKTNVLANLQTPEGFIIASDKSYANVFLRERGFYLGGRLGKIFGLSPNNPRSGLRVTLGAGLLQHKIRVQDDPTRFVPQLAGDYKKGYDRLTNGLTLKQFIGYQHLDPNGRINFFAGFEIMEGFTQSRRDFDFDTRRADTENRFDLLWGIRLGWVLPFYFSGGEDIFY